MAVLRPQRSKKLAHDSTFKIYKWVRAQRVKWASGFNFFGGEIVLWGKYWALKSFPNIPCYEPILIMYIMDSGTFYYLPFYSDMYVYFIRILVPVASYEHAARASARIERCKATKLHLLRLNSFDSSLLPVILVPKQY